MKTKHKVRFDIKVTDGSDMGLLLEQLRYAGILRIVATREDVYHGTVRDVHHGEISTIEIGCPYKISDEKQWAEANAERMRSFGIPANTVMVNL